MNYSLKKHIHSLISVKNKCPITNFLLFPLILHTLPSVCPTECPLILKWPKKRSKNIINSKWKNTNSILEWDPYSETENTPLLLWQWWVLTNPILLMVVSCLSILLSCLNNSLPKCPLLKKNLSNPAEKKNRLKNPNKNNNNNNKIWKSN